MLHRKTLIVLLLALILGCTPYKEWRKARKAEFEKVYQQQLISYNEQIREGVKIYHHNVRVREDEARQDIALRAAQQQNAREQQERSLNELVAKRRALKIKVIEQLGSLPEWWTEEKSITEQ
jgi:predicted HicB family RNase H-like nuclease